MRISCTGTSPSGSAGRETCDQRLSCTTVAPNPPRSGGASANEATSGCFESAAWTIRRWTPIPRPWISRTSAKPWACASFTYSSTTDATSRGANAWRSSASSIGIRTGSSGSELHTAGHVLLPVLKTQEILSCKLALSEGGGALEEGDVDNHDALRPRGLGHFLRHHLPHERNRDTAEPMHDLVGAANARARQDGAIGRQCGLGLVFARLGHELLQPQRHVLGHPGLDAAFRRVRVDGRPLELVGDGAEQLLEPAQPGLQRGEPLVEIRFHWSSLHVTPAAGGACASPWHVDTRRPTVARSPRRTRGRRSACRSAGPRP